MILATALVGLAASCGSSDDEAGAARAGAGGVGGAGGITDAGRDRFDSVIEAQPPLDAPESGRPSSPLCGVGTCNPDDPQSCEGFEGGSPDGGTGGAGGHAGAAPDASVDSGDGAPDGNDEDDAGMDAQARIFPPPATAIDAGYPGTQPGSGSEAGDAATVDETYSAFACRITRDVEGRIRGCAPSGSGAADAPCVSSGDCQPGLACIGEDSAARCRPLCCSGECLAASTYCAERPLREDFSNAPSPGPVAYVPVCVKADACSLAEPYPCPTDRECACPSDTACMLVSADGTTSCIKPGTGLAGESCPCAWGQICSRATNTCLKLCPIGSSDCPTGGWCQDAGLPQGWGVCIGQTASDAG